MLITKSVDVPLEVLVFVVVVGVITWKWFSQRHLPPGPWGLPLVGYLPFVGDKPELTFVKLGKKYGKIFSMRLGQKLVIVLNDYTVLKEAFVKQGSVFIARPPGFAMALTDDEKGLTNDKGESYLNNRRFFLSTLRDFGVGKTDLEPMMHEEIGKCMNLIAESNGKPMNPNRAFMLSTANIICALTLGVRFEFDDPKLEWMLHMSARFLKIAGPLEFRQYLPILKYLPFGKAISRHNALEKIKSKFAKFHLDIIDAHQINSAEDSQDYIGAYLSQQMKQGNDGSFNLEYLVGTLELIFIAGAETVSSTLRWALLYLTSNPSVQAKVQAEIDDVIGSERFPSMMDQTQMPYTRATIMEVNRYASIAPLGVVRGNMEDVIIEGYRIPKGTFFIPNIWAIHYDDSIWEDPTSFKPERFLDENGMVKKCEYLVAFAIGKRSCVGEAIAKVQLFLFFTSLLQRFTLEPENYDPQTFKYQSGDTRIPDPFTIRAVQRDSFNLT